MLPCVLYDSCRQKYTEKCEQFSHFAVCVTSAFVLVTTINSGSDFVAHTADLATRDFFHKCRKAATPVEYKQNAKII